MLLNNSVNIIKIYTQSKINIMFKKIKTFEDACKKINISTDLPEVSMLPEPMQKVVVSNYKLLIIAKAINNGWTPNWNDGTWKYYPWFNMSSSGSGFSYFVFDYVYALSDVGSRLCFEKREQAEYFGKQFIELFKDVMVIE